MESVKRILIVKLGAVGDCVHTLFALDALRNKFPDAVIGWAVEEKSYNVISWHLKLDRVHLVRRKEGIFTWLKDAESVADFGYDLAIDFSNLFKSGWVALRSGAKIRIGFSRKREGNFLFTNKRIKTSKKHMMERYFGLLRPLGIKEIPDPKGIFVSYKQRNYIDEFLQENISPLKKTVVINPNATWQSKLYPLEKYAEVAHELIREGHHVLLIWGGGNENQRVKRLSGMIQEKVIIAPKTNLKELYYLMSKCHIYIGNDSGPMHLAAFSGIGVVGIFGPTNPDRVSPWTSGKIVITAGRQCGKWPCEKRKCKNPFCVTNVDPMEIVAAGKKLLEETE